MKNIRSSLLLTLVLACTGLAPAADGAERVSPLPSHPVAGPGWSLSPYSPCVRDSVTLIVMGFASTPCDSFIGVDKLGALHVRVRTLVRDGYHCFAAPIYFPIRVPLGRFPAGPYTLDLENQVVHLAQDGTTHTETTHTPVSFYVTADCPPPPGLLPHVGAIFTDPRLPCPEKPTTLVLEGVFRDGCGQVIDSSPPGSGNVELTLKVAVGPDTACTLALKPWRVEFPLGSLSSGNHRVAITLHVVDRDSTGTGLVRRTYYGAHEFFVGERCDSIPPPPGPLPFVNFIHIGPARNLCEPTICPTDSIRVVVSGEFPDDCHQFRGIQLLPSLVASPLPQPPVVRIIVDVTGCHRRPCADVQVPWAAAVTLPPLPARGYNLMVELAQVSCSDSFPPGQLFRALAPFAVADSCRVPAPCLIAGFAPGPGNLTACNATVAPGQPAELTFLVSPRVALAGLQGEFRLGPPGLRITKLEAIGPATGMILNWNPTPEGARFVMFAERGAPITPITPFMETVFPPGWPVLRLTVEQPASTPAPDFTVVRIENLLGSDIEGHAVEVCPPPPCVWLPTEPPPIGIRWDPRFGFGTALICAQHGCDFNADGFEDVRDLVLMVHCVTGEGPCPDDVGTRFDCDADSAFTLRDVVCCARHILRRLGCPDCPRDSTGTRPEPSVWVSFGQPVATAAGVDVPLRVAGADRLGAALLGLRLPLDRYQVTGVDGAGGTGWLSLHEVRDDRVILALIDAGTGVAAGERGSQALDLTLHLALKPGQSPGGEVSAVAGEFSGPDGAMLAVTLGTPSRELPGPARLALGENRPNPFSAETRFTLELVEGADVVVGIYDLRGRAVATLFRGHLPSGPREFRWDGRSADGTAAANGVYFYRIVAGGKALARKLILMRGN
mgnify:CR=1 FL=1